ncbi:MAG: membrane protein insertion efficiency factor YidD [Acidimicrobiia bacterium]|nr:membrane protein insertion efficiency factor YidD [Acidimicrobiia bacterium]
MKRAVVAAITFYRRYLSPQTAANCRYQPTCSAYAVEAVERHGVVKGGFMALRRLTRCHPLRPGGFDPVPARRDGGLAREV